jgi:ATP-binding cassette subfamily B protein
MTWITTLQTLFGACLSIALVYSYTRTNQDPQGLLLLLFWAQRIPALGQALSQGLVGLAPIRSSMLRLFEPLRSQEETALPAENTDLTPTSIHGAQIRFEDVHVLAGGQEILKGLNLTLNRGEHVAVVGQSGAGKSSLLALMLGIHKPTQGRIFLDDEEVSGEELFRRLHPALSWVDPTIQLWNDTLLSNIQFGAQNAPQRPIAQVIAQSDLIEILDRLPEGFRTSLGDGGALLSGGEGQRVRLARALLKRDTRLALLDEPFRGLDRGKRRLLQERLRALWADSTLVCVTHDVSDTQTFQRVLVVEDGAIVEADSPERLLARDSRYRRLLEADRRAATGVWSAAHWRHITVHEGRVVAPPERIP